MPQNEGVLMRKLDEIMKRVQPQLNRLSLRMHPTDFLRFGKEKSAFRRILYGGRRCGFVQLLRSTHGRSAPSFATSLLVTSLRVRCA